MKATQNESSTAYESRHNFRSSRGKILFDLWCTNKDATKTYVMLFDCYTAPTPGSDTFTASAALNLIEASGAHATWLSGTPVTFTSAGTLPGGLEAGKKYYLGRVNDTTWGIFYKLQDAIDYNNTVGAYVDITSAGTGAHTMHVLDAVEKPPLHVPADSWGYLTWANGRQFSDGIYALSSSAVDAVTENGAHMFFDATYST